MQIIDGNKIPKEFFERQQIQEINSVKRIIADVKNNGDIAVKKYSKKFDNTNLDDFEVSRKDIQKAYMQIDKKPLKALRKAATNIRSFSVKQFSQLKGFETIIDGNQIGQKIVPIETVGCYVPGGLYPLPSSALMCVIPAKVVGVKNVIVCSPKIKPATIVAADIAGADKIFNIGGVQAIAAMAYGTKSIPKVDKIVGPGNKYVTAAKKEVYGQVGIDFLAGPSEVLIIADNLAKPKLIATDLLAQAEHDPNAQSILITTSRKLALQVNKEIGLQLNNLSTQETAEQSLKKGLIIICPSIKEAVDISNKKAPEHLEIQVRNPQEWIGKMVNYGSLFIGEYSAEVFGDYCSGTNHTLPTGSSARYTGGLSVKDFVKILTYQKITKQGSKKLIPIASELANIEGLDAHKKSAEARKETN
jgi:histidinol dehydrogenase